MTAGATVRSPSGEQVTLVDVGQRVLADTDAVRVWHVALDPGQVHPWHRHHNPYVVLSIHGSSGRMDWLDGSAPRFIEEYRGGSVYLPTSPVHRLTNLGSTRYVNRLVEFKHLGELRSEVLDIGPGARSVQGERPGAAHADGRQQVLTHEHTTVWETEVPAKGTVDLDLPGVQHVLVPFDTAADEETGGVRVVGGGATSLRNDTSEPAQWFVVEMTYLTDPVLTEENQ